MNRQTLRTGGQSTQCGPFLVFVSCLMLHLQTLMLGSCEWPGHMVSFLTVSSESSAICPYRLQLAPSSNAPCPLVASVDYPAGQPCSCFSWLSAGHQQPLIIFLGLHILCSYSPCPLSHRRENDFNKHSELRWDSCWNLLSLRCTRS